MLNLCWIQDKQSAFLVTWTSSNILCNKKCNIRGNWSVMILLCHICSNPPRSHMNWSYCCPLKSFEHETTHFLFFTVDFWHLIWGHDPGCHWNHLAWRTSHLCSFQGTSVCIFTPPPKFLYLRSAWRTAGFVLWFSVRDPVTAQVRGLLLSVSGESYVWVCLTPGAYNICFTEIMGIHMHSFAVYYYNLLAEK